MASGTRKRKKKAAEFAKSSGASGGLQTIPINVLLTSLDPAEGTGSRRSLRVLLPKNGSVKRIGSAQSSKKLYTRNTWGGQIAVPLQGDDQTVDFSSEAVRDAVAEAVSTDAYSETARDAVVANWHERNEINRTGGTLVNILIRDEDVQKIIREFNTAIEHEAPETRRTADIACVRVDMLMAYSIARQSAIRATAGRSSAERATELTNITMPVCDDLIYPRAAGVRFQSWGEFYHSGTNENPDGNVANLFSNLGIVRDLFDATDAASMA